MSIRQSAVVDRTKSISWPRRVRRGAAVTALSGVLTCLILLVWGDSFRSGMGLGSIALVILAPVSGTLSVLGWWWLTSPPPVIAREMESRRIRRTARTTALLCVIIPALWLIFAIYRVMLFARSPSTWSSVEYIDFALAGLWVAAIVVRNVTGSLFLRRMTVRLGWGFAELFCLVVIILSPIAIPSAAYLFGFNPNWWWIAASHRMQEVVALTAIVSSIIGAIFYEAMVLYLVVFLRTRAVVELSDGSAMLDISDTAADPATPETFSPEGRIESEHLCVQCAYNLRSLPRSGSCPECGIPIESSLHFGGQRGAQWPARVRRGAICIAGAGICAGLFVVLAVATSRSPMFVIAAPSTALIASVLSILGWVWLTTPPPSPANAADARILRSAARVGGIASIAFLVLIVALALLSAVGVSSTSTVDEIVAFGLVLCWGMSLTTRNVAGGLYLVRLARRLKWGLAELYCLVLVLSTPFVMTALLWNIYRQFFAYSFTGANRASTVMTDIMNVTAMVAGLISVVFYELMAVFLAFYLRPRDVIKFGSER